MPLSTPQPGAPTVPAAPAAPFAPAAATGVADGVLAEVLSAFAAALDQTDVPADASFFALGGASIDARQACARLSERLGLTVPVSTLVRERTARQLARRLTDRLEQQAAPAADTASAGGPAPLLPTQVGFLYLPATSLAAHCPLAWWLDGPVDADVLAQAVQDVHARHEGLRCRYLAAPVPCAEPVSPAPPAQFRALPDAGTDPAAESALEAELFRPLAVADGLVWRAVLVRSRASGHTLFGLVVHHVAVDYPSAAVLVADLATAYTARVQGRAPEFDRPAPGPAAIGAAFRAQVGGADLDAQRDHWRTVLRGVPPLALSGQDAPAPPGGPAAAIPLEISPAELAGWDALARRHQVTRFTALLAAYAWAVGEVCRQHDLCVMAPVSRRGHPDLQHAVACLSDVVCLRLTLDARAGPGAALSRTDAAVQAALAAQDIPFAEVLATAGAPPGVLAQNMFVLQDEAMAVPAFPDVRARFRRPELTEILPELLCELLPDAAGGARGQLLYRTGRVPAGTAESLAAAFRQVLADPHALLVAARS